MSKTRRFPTSHVEPKGGAASVSARFRLVWGPRTSGSRKIGSGGAYVKTTLGLRTRGGWGLTILVAHPLTKLLEPVGDEDEPFCL